MFECVCVCEYDRGVCVYLCMCKKSIASAYLGKDRSSQGIHPERPIRRRLEPLL